MAGTFLAMRRESCCVVGKSGRAKIAKDLGNKVKRYGWDFITSVIGNLKEFLKRI